MIFGVIVVREKQLYYIVDRINNKENLIVIPDDVPAEEIGLYFSYIIDKTGIDFKEKAYPIGTILSVCMHLVPAMIGLIRQNQRIAHELCFEVFEHEYNDFPFQNVDKSSFTEHFFKKQHFPFHKDILYFLTFLVVNQLLFANNPSYKGTPKYSDINSKIENCINFIKICASEPKYCTMNTLHNVSAIFGVQLNGFKNIHIPENKRYNQSQLCNKIEKISKTSEYLSEVGYHINSIEELLFSSLQEIFYNRCLVKVCQHCNSYFVAKSARQKYCENPSPENYNRTCKIQVKHEQKLSGDISKASRQKYKSIYTMLLNRQSGNHSQRELNRREKDFEKFKLRAKKQRILVAKEKRTEQDYINWMDTYWKEVKDTAKNRKQKYKERKRHKTQK